LSSASDRNRRQTVVGVDLGHVSPRPQHVAVADAIRRAITLGRYGPDDRLPPERELAETLGVGRMTLRAAIRELNGEGLVRTTRGPRGGTVVVGSQPRRRGREKALAGYIDELRENYEFRMAVEPLAASLSAERANHEQRETIARIAVEQPATLSHYRTLDSRFHLAIGEACGNRLVLEAVRDARAEFFVWADALWMPSESLSEETETSGAQHTLIAKAIRRRDPARARQRMIEHLEWSRSSFLSRLL
jgi:GntR family transcriptional repressor for pyruvate dehydrogenase complex